MKRYRIRGSRRRDRDGDGDPARPSSRSRRPAAKGAAEVWPPAALVPWPVLLETLIAGRDTDRSFWQLLRDLGFDRDAADALREQISFLERARILVHHRRSRIALHTRDRLCVGRLSIPASSRAVGRHWGATGSFGFVTGGGGAGDLYVPARGLGGARHGDLVLARAGAPLRGDRPQGEVVAVLERASALFTGEVVEIEGRLRVRPRDEKGQIEMSLEAAPAPERLESDEGYRRRRSREEEPREGFGAAPAPKAGDLVLAEALSGGSARARVVEVIGPVSDPAAAERMILAEFSLPGPFTAEAEAEAAGAAERPIDAAAIEGREDFRDRTVVTIDPADARDFDDAISFDPLPGGGLRLWVHIADVAAYVHPDGALDREAAARGTSVYFPGRVVPMLPHALSSGICSLKEGEDRLVQSVGIDYDASGRAGAARFVDGVIRSTARLAYEEAFGILEGGAPRSGVGAAVPALLAALGPLAKKLTAARVARGALDLDLPELELTPGKDGLPGSLRARDRNDAHRLIEEFMLAANEAVAKHLAREAIASLHRVHEPPDRGEVEEVEELLAPLGGRRRGGRALAPRLQALLDSFRGRPEEGIVAKQVLRAMKIARYAAEPAGHFGLALDHYTHFTSPIRRYPDLVVHRILRESRRQKRRPAPDGALPPPERLAQIAAESSRLERRAEAAERALADILLAHHLRPRIGERFHGRVSGVVKTGLFVALSGRDLPEGIAEGYAPAPRPERYRLTEPIRVRLEEADLLRGRLRLSLAGE